MVSTTKIYTCIALTLLFNVSILKSDAQVSIGLAEPPVEGAILQLKNIAAIDDGSANATKGLGLPRVSIRYLDKLQLGDNEELIGEDRNAHIGLIVYNTKRVEEPDNKIYAGLYVWTGEQWDALSPPDSEPGTPTILDVQKEILSKELYDDPVNYPIGHLGQYTDSRNNGQEVNKYYYARFYAAKVKEKVTTTYQDNTGTWTEVEEKERIEDGVWMTENLRTKFAPNAESTPFPYLEDVDNAFLSTYWAYPGVSFIDPNPPTFPPEEEGLLYSWKVATILDNGVYGRDGATGKELLDQSACIEEKEMHLNPIQGVCPDGWYLPNAQDWFMLRAAMVANPSYYSTEPNLTLETIAKAFKHPDTWHPDDEPEHAGTSKLAHEGGFAAYLTAFWNGDPYYYGTEAYFWTASNEHSFGLCDTARYFMFLGWAGDTAIGATFRTMPYAIRCMKY